MIFAATHVIRLLEDSFNYIYRAAHDRPLFFRFAIYIASLVVLPGITILFGWRVSIFVDQLNPPQLFSLAGTGSQTWIAGSQGILRLREDGRIHEVDLSEKVDLNAPFREVYFDLKSRSSGHFWDVVGESGPRESIADAASAWVTPGSAAP